MAWEYFRYFSFLESFSTELRISLVLEYISIQLRYSLSDVSPLRSYDSSQLSKDKKLTPTNPVFCRIFCICSRDRLWKYTRYQTCSIDKSCWSTLSRIFIILGLKVANTPPDISIILWLVYGTSRSQCPTERVADIARYDTEF